MSEEKGVVKYQAKDGQEISLSFENVKQYLVQGNREAITKQELMYFLGICKSRGLNPFKKDAYLIKYGNDPAAIVTSVDYFRARARAQKDCRGWQNGIIVQKENGELRYSKGIVLDGEKLIGGWFSAKPEGWDAPFELEVNLPGYIKKTKDGRTTRFWEEHNQPTMIAKVAESQGLRHVWPDEFQGLYEETEIRMARDVEMKEQPNGSYAHEETPISAINKQVREQEDAGSIPENEIINLFWHLKEPGFKTQLPAFIQAYPDWPTEVQTKFEQKYRKIMDKPFGETPEPSPEQTSPPDPASDTQEQEKPPETQNEPAQQGIIEASVPDYHKILRQVIDAGHTEHQLREYALSLGQAEAPNEQHETWIISDAFVTRWLANPETAMRHFEDSVIPEGEAQQ